MDLSTYYPLIIALLLGWSFILTIFYFRLISTINTFLKGTKKKDLISVLNKLIKSTRDNNQDLIKTNKRIDREIELSKLNLKKLSFKRFNPFTSTGGDQSFILCLLDENDDGVVLSSLHSRENTRIYAKKIVGGKSPDQVLSKEEQNAIKQATK